MTELPQAPTTTNEGIAIHLVYINEHLKSLDLKMTEVGNNTVHRDEHVAVIKRIETNESILKVHQTFIDTLVGKMWGIGIIAGLIMAILSFAANHYFK